MSLVSQASRFLLVGGAATVLHYVILGLLVRFELAEPLTASSLGFVISALFNYLLNRRFTFQSHRRHREALPRFAAVALAGLLINGIVLWALHYLVGLHYLLAQVFATGATLFWNFVLNRIWTFSSSAGVQSQTEKKGTLS